LGLGGIRNDTPFPIASIPIINPWSARSSWPVRRYATHMRLSKRAGSVRMTVNVIRNGVVGNGLEEPTNSMLQHTPPASGSRGADDAPGKWVRIGLAQADRPVS
jgi:hypothetical protein